MNLQVLFVKSKMNLARVCSINIYIYNMYINSKFGFDLFNILGVMLKLRGVCNLFICTVSIYLILRQSLSIFKKKSVILRQSF